MGERGVVEPVGQQRHQVLALAGIERRDQVGKLGLVKRRDEPGQVVAIAPGERADHAVEHVGTHGAGLVVKAGPAVRSARELCACRAGHLHSPRFR